MIAFEGMERWESMTDEEFIDGYRRVGLDREYALAVLGMLRNPPPWPID